MKTSMQDSFRSGSFWGLTGAAAVLALGLDLAGPHRAYAAPHPLAVAGASDLGVTILSPDPHTPLAGLKPVEISAFYQGSPANQIIAIELFIDGAKAATKTLDAPETRGVVSFLIDAGQISAGTHQVVIRATAADQEVASAKSRFTFNGMDPDAVPLAAPTPGGPALSLPTNPALTSGLPPTLRLISPTEDGRVQGVVTLHVEASDPSGKAPYISLFIDKTFKTLRNYAPYEFEWDTTTYSNGYHTVEAYGYNDTPNVGHAKSLRLYVNNPGGDTGIRHDLLDGTPPAAVKTARVFTAPKKRVSRVAAPALPVVSDARIASIMPSHLRSTREIVRQLASGAGSLHFGSLDYATELSTPFAEPQPQAAVAPARSFKPMPAAKTIKPILTRAENADLNADLAAIAETPTPSRSWKKALPLQQLASVRLPESGLSSPFVAMPEIAPVFAQAVRLAARPVLQTPVKMQSLHTLHIRLPLGVNALLRSVGQKTLLFNHTMVTMDRPLTLQNRVLFGPLRQIFEQGGGTLTWQSYSGTVHAKSATKDILLTLGSNQAQVNAKQITLDGKPYLLLGRTMVPLSFIAVALDATVQFDAATGHLLVTSK